MLQNTAIADALRAARQDAPLSFSGAVLPFKPPIDKAAAYAVLSMHCSDDLAYLQVCKTNVFTDAQIKEWESKGVCCIDLGDRKYHKVKEGSATEWVVNHCSLPLSPGVTKVVELVNKNNNDGSLKQGGRRSYSIPYLMREFYELERKDADWWTTRIVQRVADVVIAFVRVTNGDGRLDGNPPMSAAIKKLAKKFGWEEEGQDVPFTIGLYIHHLSVLGATDEEIFEKVGFWQNCLLRLDTEERRADKEFKTMRRDEFAIGEGKKGIVLRTDDYFLSKKTIRSGQYAVRVIIASDGHTVITTQGLDVSCVYRYLNKKEPGRWYHEERMGAIMNGGPMYTETTPTEIKAGEIVSQLKHFLGPKDQSKKQ